MNITIEETPFSNNREITSETSIFSEKIQKTMENGNSSIKDPEKGNIEDSSNLLDIQNTDDSYAILQQVEFYFSDSNLPFDKFLWQTSQKNNGWVPIDVISTFKRMHRFRSMEAIVKALRTSKNLLEVDEDGKHVRRKIPLVKPGEDEKTAYMERSVYVKGFGEETETSQIDIENFFKKYGKINVVRLRREDNGLFKGSVFCEFAELEFKENFLKTEPKPKYKGNDLLIMSKQEYIDMKSINPGEKLRKKRVKFNAFKEMELNNKLSQNNEQKKNDSQIKYRNKKRKKFNKFNNQNNSPEKNK
ncbi:hypothetical protein PCANB_002931 [Pneumocystis canis]|nr:hypothetical protein PCANB_002931 [Pneumocystis canis]